MRGSNTLTVFALAEAPSPQRRPRRGDEKPASRSVEAERPADNPESTAESRVRASGHHLALYTVNMDTTPGATATCDREGRRPFPAHVRPIRVLAGDACGWSVGLRLHRSLLSLTSASSRRDAVGEGRALRAWSVRALAEPSPPRIGAAGGSRSEHASLARVMAA